MRCAACGARVQKKASFCENCGKEISRRENSSARTKYIIAAAVVWALLIAAIALVLFGGRDSDGEKAGTPERVDCTEWIDELPEGVTEENCIIETQTLYRSKSLETIVSTDSGLDGVDGWVLCGQTQGGEFGMWSDWSDTPIAAGDDRQTESQTRYRSRERSTTVSENDRLSGWTLFDEETVLGEYDAWSAWQTQRVDVTALREPQIETKTQYRFRDIGVHSGYSDWSAWSAWQDTAIYSDDYTQVEQRTLYEYGYYYCYSCGAHWHGYGFPCGMWGNECSAEIQQSSWTTVWGTTPQSEMGFKDWHGTGYTYAYYNGELVFRNIYGDYSMTQYRSRTWTAGETVGYGDWSEWSDTRSYGSSTREVEERTVYRYRQRSETTLYHYEKWSDWGQWQTEPITESEDIQVERGVFYRSRERTAETEYYYERWPEQWSGWTPRRIDPADSVMVETCVQYRYTWR